ncbi:MAG: hypothetical protein JSW11_00665 [Candidatus Heimdallarchaeota archaeon]|nr:MAG: hypothetical protein JSW11_00665 [Candidatus Heimdallarchaeota archaeon]
MLLSILYMITTLIVIIKPRGFPVPEVTASYALFGAPLAGFLLILSISGYLLFRYFAKKRPLEQAPFQLIWGTSFLIYSITLAGLVFQAWGFEFANMTDPLIFLIWRTPMIIWVTGMWIGVSKLLVDDDRLIYFPAFSILILGEVWFIIGLIFFVDIEFTMNGFLYWEFVLMASILALLWYQYGKGTELSSPNVIVLGFVLFGITYLAWAPWHSKELEYMWFVWFNVYLVSLAFLLTGFYALPKEILGKFKDT